MTVEKVKKPDGVTVTLCMIVKDEEKIIERCLESMLPYIDRYDITDTGSSDNTKQVIKDFFDKHGIPGDVYDVEWQGFGKSRTAALENCKDKATYAWMIDADDFVEGKFEYPPVMDLDAYSLSIKRGNFTWYRNQIFNTETPWEYLGVLHEYAACPKRGQDLKIGRIRGEHYSIQARTEGARNQNITAKEKYTKDAAVLEDALNNKESPHYEPDNERYQFYLAQSWFDAGEIEKALENYEKRVNMGGWEEEVYYALYRCAICKAMLQRTEMEVAKAFIDAWSYRPIRAEPLVNLARLYRMNNKPRHAYLYASQAVKIPMPHNDILFIENECYDWVAVDEFAAVAFYVYRFEEGLQATEWLMKNPKVPENERERIQKNHVQYTNKINEIKAKMNTEPGKIPLDKIKQVPSMIPQTTPGADLAAAAGKVKPTPAKKSTKQPKKYKSRSKN